MFPVKNMGSQKLISDRQQMEDILSKAKFIHLALYYAETRIDIIDAEIMVSF